MQSDFLTETNVKRSSRGKKVVKAVSFAVLALFGIVGYAGYRSHHQVESDVPATPTNLQQYNPQYDSRIQQLRGECPQVTDNEFRQLAAFMQIMDSNQDLRVTIEEMAALQSMGKNVDQVKAQLAPAFRMMDQNGDGSITVGEFCALKNMQQQQPKSFSLQATQDQLKALHCPNSSDFEFKIAYNQMQKVDKDMNNKVSFEEFEAYMRSFFEAFNKPVTEKELTMFRMAFQQADLNGNGKLTLDEFCASTKVSQKMGLLYNYPQPVEYCPGDARSSMGVQAMLMQIDTNKDGVISIDEYVNFIRQQQPNMTPEQAAMVFRYMSNGDDILTVRELCDLIAKSSQQANLFNNVASFVGTSFVKSYECRDVSNDAWEATLQFQQRYDKNMDGIYTFEECYSQVQLEQPDMTRERFRYEFNRIDHNFDGRLSTSEVCHQIEEMIQEYLQDQYGLFNLLQ